MQVDRHHWVVSPITPTQLHVHCLVFLETLWDVPLNKHDYDAVDGLVYGVGQVTVFEDTVLGLFTVVGIDDIVNHVFAECSCPSERAGKPHLLNVSTHVRVLLD